MEGERDGRVIEVAFIEFEGVTEAAVMLGYDVEFTELVGEPDGSVALVTLGSIPPVGVGVVMLMFDTDILGGESLRAPNIACWVTAFFSYMLSRLPAPQLPRSQLRREKNAHVAARGPNSLCLFISCAEHVALCDGNVGRSCVDLRPAVALPSIFHTGKLIRAAERQAFLHRHRVIGKGLF